MKKIIYYVNIAALTTMFSSCGKNKKEASVKGCWKVTVTATMPYYSSSSTTYIWGTEKEVDNAIQQIKQYNVYSLSFNKSKMSNNQSDCY